MGNTRTTIDLPAELLQRAKVTAIQRGATLKELFTHALEREIDTPTMSTPPHRVRFPIFRSRAPGSLKLDSAAISRLEDDR